MKRLLLLITFIASLGAACSGAAATQIATTPAPQATVVAATAPATGDDVRTYIIVPAESSVAYNVSEVFINKGNKLNLAIGTTQAVQGNINLNFTHPDQTTVGPITVDISTFVSDSGMRDRRIRDGWLESAKFPIATFTPTQIDGLPADAKEGNELTFSIIGDLLIRDTTQPTTFAVTAILNGDTLTGSATTTIKMSDFNFQAPDIAGMLKADDEAKLEFKFVARP